MTNYNIDSNLLLDFESFSETGIELTSEQVDRALELSDRLEDPQRQWQTYLNSLAWFGFKTWLESRDSFSIDDTYCSVSQPYLANYIDGVFNLTVSGYKICLLTNGVAIDELVTVDRAVIDLPEYAAHFYVVVEVVEELQEVRIDRFIARDEILARLQNADLTANADWTYELPTTWFNPEVDELLLQLRCLEPNPITLTATAAEDIQNQLESLIPQLQSGNPLHQILTWEQGAAILSNLDLLSWLYELQSDRLSVSNALAALQTRLGTAVAEVTQRAINVRSWLSNELDELAQNLAWTLLPAPAFAPSGLRDLQAVNRESPAEEFAAIVTQLRDSGEDIPPEARGACQDLHLANHELRLFVVTWASEETLGTPEWNLLLVLGALPNNYLPQGLKLKLKQNDTLLDERVVAEDTADSYLYTQVIGELDEQFTINVKLSNGETVTFPNFAFE